MKKGKFVVIEGIDGCGKSMQMEMLKEKLKEEVVFTREHTLDGPVGRLIEEIVNKRVKLDAVAVQLCFTADRIDHVKRVVELELKKGKTVISDRYYWSTVAYGSLVADKEWLLELNEKVVRKPDLVILIDVSAEIGVERMKGSRNEKTIFEKRKKLAKARKTYLWLAEKYKKSCVVIDGTKKPEEINQKILNILEIYGVC